MTSQEVVADYAAGRREFYYAQIDDAEFPEVSFPDICFDYATLRRANFQGALLLNARFRGADISRADFTGAALSAADLSSAVASEAIFRSSDLTRAFLGGTTCIGTDLREANLGMARLDSADLSGAHLDGVHLGGTGINSLDAKPFCEAKGIRHESPSPVDSRTVVATYPHPQLQRFMTDCGVPDIFATYMIVCAHALNEADLRSLMQSTFISYGGPDEPFARKLYDSLRSHGVATFFFPENATLGERIDTEVYNNLQKHDRIVLICSAASLNRPGVLHEIWETLGREARDGGATYLLPITLDEYVFTDWKKKEPVLAERVGRRIVGDFRGTINDSAVFDTAVKRLIDALMKKRP